MKPPHELCYSHAARGNARFLSRLYDRRLAPAGVNIQQLTILSMILHHPGILIAELAEQMIMERTTLVRALRPLQDAGYVDSEPFGTRRSLALTISPSGRQKAAQAFPLWSKAQQEFETIFGVKNAKTLRGTMQRASRLG